MEKILQVEGMTCVNCANGINRYLSRKGLEGVNANFTTGEVRLTYNTPDQLQLAKDSIAKLGFTLLEPVPETDANANTFSSLLKNWWNIEHLFYFSAFFSLPLLLSMLPPLYFLQAPMVQIALATPVFFIGLLFFGKKALASLQTGVANMDVLVVLGASAAYFYSLANIFLSTGSDYVYFETAAIIITLVLMGKFLEHKAIKRTTSAVESLSQLQVKTAKRLTNKSNKNQVPSSEKFREVKTPTVETQHLASNSTNKKQVPPSEGFREVFETVPIDQLQLGDVVLVNTGEQVPTDGKIIWGTATLDESMISGESLPLDKKVGDLLIGGSLMQQGSVQLAVTAIGKQTTLAQIIQLVKDAQADKPKIQRLADRISAWFVPAILILAALTFLLAYFVFQIGFQQALMNSIAVLVVACPCAMGLATPTAMVVAMGALAKKGILIKGASTLEQVANIQTFVFDKTGTLTTGDFTITNITPHHKHDVRHIKSLLLAIEQHSIHPIATSIVRQLQKDDSFTQNKLPQFAQITEQKGMGMTAQDHHNNTYQVGSYRIAQHLTTDDSHSLYLLQNDQLIATLQLENALKPQAAETIAYLHAQNRDTILLSGDKQQIVEKVAQQVGITNYFGEQLPHEKLAKITTLKGKFQTTNSKSQSRDALNASRNNTSLLAMVGDGINDAPALSKADIGISLSNATQVARDAAQVILLNGDISLLRPLLHSSKATLRTVKQNLFWAFFYNVLMIPFAAIGWLNPMLAAGAMALSSILVVGNSLLLARKTG